MTYFPQPRPQQYLDEDPFHRDSSPVAGTFWSPTASMSPQHPQRTPFPDYRPLPGQPWSHAGVLQDHMVSG